jgi:hypothetical protein
MSAAEIYDELAPHDLAELKRAVALLSSGNFAVRASQQLGRSVSGLSYFIPAAVRAAALEASEFALASAMRWAVRHVSQRPPAYGRSRSFWAASGVCGALGGGFGLMGSVIELPVTTTLLMRSIAAIAQEEGEDLTDPEAPIACLEVFALDGGGTDATIDSSYFAIRAALGRSVSEAGRYLAQRKGVDASAPALVRLISHVAARFGLVVSEKFVAQAIPVVGAAFGAGVNLAFTGHFQNLARGHFIMRRLERFYGAAAVREAAIRVRPVGGV